MSRYVADTMAIVLYLENRKLPINVKTAFLNAGNYQTIISFSAISLMEIGYLFEKGRIDTSVEDVIKFVSTNKNFRFANLDSKIVKYAFEIKDIPELHDRLIAATASVEESILITNDPIIRKSGAVKTIWQ